MSSKNKKSRQQPNIKKFRSDVAKLKKAGLLSNRVDARSQKMTRYMKSQIKKYGDVLDGTAKVVKVPKRSLAKDFSENFRTKGKAVIVPAGKHERLRYNKNKKQIVASGKVGAKSGKRLILSGKLDAEKLPQGPNISYRAPAGNYTTDDLQDLIKYMQPYSAKWTNWINYVELIEE